MASFKIILPCVGSRLPTSAAVMEDRLIISDKEELIVQDGETAYKTALIVTAIDKAIKVEPTDDGGMVVKVESCYKLLPEKIPEKIAESKMGGAANFKVKLD